MTRSGLRGSAERVVASQAMGELAGLREARRLLTGLFDRLEQLDSHGVVAALYAVGYAAASHPRTEESHSSPGAAWTDGWPEKAAECRGEFLQLLAKLTAPDRRADLQPSRCRGLLMDLLARIDALGAVLYHCGNAPAQPSPPTGPCVVPEWVTALDSPATLSAEPLGRLDDGTPYYAPIGQRVYDLGRDRVQCHLCGRWLKAVTGRHLVAHPGWTRSRYYAAFGLVDRLGLVRPSTSQRRREVARERAASDERVRAGLAQGWQMARSGRLSRLGAEATRGRPQRAERVRNQRGKPSQPGSPRRLAAARRRSAALEAETARKVGFETFASYFLDRRARGWSLGEIARETGRSNRWVSKAADRYEGAKPAKARATESHARQRLRRLNAAARALGFAGAAAYLRRRHLEEGRTVNALVQELGSHRAAVLAAMRDNDIPYRPGPRGRTGSKPLRRGRP